MMSNIAFANRPCRAVRATLTAVVLAVCLILPLVNAFGETYPSKTIRFIVPVAPGGSVDAMARIVGEKFRKKWDQPVVVENRPGASNTIGIEAVLTAAPDGYTVLFGPGSPLAVNKLLNPKRPLDPDLLEPVSRIATNPLLLIVQPAVPAKSLVGLVAYAKTNPGRLNYASAGDGGTPHLAAEMLQRQAGIKITKVPYKAVALAMVDLLSRQVDLMFVDISTALEHVQGGKLRVLAVASQQRHRAFPDIPAMTELLPGFIAENWFAMAVPPKTPKPIIDLLSVATREAIREPDVQKRLQDMGGIEAIGSTPAEMSSHLRTERARWDEVIRGNRIVVD